MERRASARRRRSALQVYSEQITFLVFGEDGPPVDTTAVQRPADHSGRTRLAEPARPGGELLETCGPGGCARDGEMPGASGRDGTGSFGSASECEIDAGAEGDVGFVAGSDQEVGAGRLRD